jgi:hypothetical protein
VGDSDGTPDVAEVAVVSLRGGITWLIVVTHIGKYVHCPRHFSVPLQEWSEWILQEKNSNAASPEYLAVSQHD